MQHFIGHRVGMVILSSVTDEFPPHPQALMTFNDDEDSTTTRKHGQQLSFNQIRIYIPKQDLTVMGFLIHNTYHSISRWDQKAKIYQIYFPI